MTVYYVMYCCFGFLLVKQYCLVFFLVCFPGHVNPFANILTGLKIGEEELKYYDLMKLEDTRYGIF